MSQTLKFGDLAKHHDKFVGKGKYAKVVVDDKGAFKLTEVVPNAHATAWKEEAKNGSGDTLYLPGLRFAGQEKILYDFLFEKHPELNTSIGKLAGDENLITAALNTAFNADNYQSDEDQTFFFFTKSNANGKVGAGIMGGTYREHYNHDVAEYKKKAKETKDKLAMGRANKRTFKHIPKLLELFNIKSSVITNYNGEEDFELDNTPKSPSQKSSVVKKSSAKATGGPRGRKTVFTKDVYDSRIKALSSDKYLNVSKVEESGAGAGSSKLPQKHTLLGNKSPLNRVFYAQDSAGYKDKKGKGPLNFLKIYFGYDDAEAQDYLDSLGDDALVVEKRPGSPAGNVRKNPVETVRGEGGAVRLEKLGRRPGGLERGAESPRSEAGSDTGRAKAQPSPVRQSRLLRRADRG